MWETLHKPKLYGTNKFRQMAQNSTFRNFLNKNCISALPRSVGWAVPASCPGMRSLCCHAAAALLTAAAVPASYPDRQLQSCHAAAAAASSCLKRRTEVKEEKTRFNNCSKVLEIQLKRDELQLAQKINIQLICTITINIQQV